MMPRTATGMFCMHAFWLTLVSGICFAMKTTVMPAFIIPSNIPCFGKCCQSPRGAESLLCLSLPRLIQLTICIKSHCWVVLLLITVKHGSFVKIEKWKENQNTVFPRVSATARGVIFEHCNNHSALFEAGKLIRKSQFDQIPRWENLNNKPIMWLRIFFIYFILGKETSCVYTLCYFAFISRVIAKHFWGSQLSNARSVRLQNGNQQERSTT